MLPDWTLGEAAIIAVAAMATALVIMAVMVLVLGLLQRTAAGIGGNNNKGAEAEIASAKALKGPPVAKVAEADAGHKVTAAISAAVYSYLQEQAPSFKAGRIRITADQPLAAGTRSNWQLAGRISLLEKRIDFANMRRK